MSGWVPMPVEVWPIVAPHLPQPWPEEAAWFDLRWHHDQEGEVPGRRELAKRWGWTPDEVRTQLRHPERWWDPRKGPLPTSRRPSDPARPKLTQADPPTPQHEQANADPPAELTQADPARPELTQQRHRRVEDPPSPTPSPPPEEQQQTLVEPPTDPPRTKGPSPAALSWEACFQVYNQEVRRNQTMAPTSLTPSRGLGKALDAMVRAHGEAKVLEVLRYIAHTDDDRFGGATFYREKQLSLTQISRHFDELLDKARNPRRPTSTGPPGRPGEWVPPTRTPEEEAEKARRDNEPVDDF